MFFQAYWRPDWNLQATVNTPELEFRYFYIRAKETGNKVIDIAVSGNEERKISFIKQNFKNIPDNFFSLKRDM